MLEFMHQGGAPMWVMLASAIVAAGVAVARGRERRYDVLGAGTILVLIEGILGMAAGMKAVSAAHEMLGGDKGSIVAAGLGELANDGILAAVLALALGVAALVARPSPATA